MAPPEGRREGRAGGDLEFAPVYEAYRAKVLAYATRLVGRSEAEDLAQEVFLKVDRALGGLSDPAKLGSWIYSITLNTARDALRRRASRIRTLPAEGVLAPPDAGGPPLGHLPDTASRSPEETTIRNEMVACYLEFVRRLPASYYEVYALAEFENLATEEIARRLGLSSGAAKIRLHRARAHLYEQLRRSCRCYTNERGELMGEPKSAEHDAD